MLLVISLFTWRNKAITFVQVLYKGTSKDEKNYSKLRWIKQWWNADVYKHKADCRGLKHCTVPSSYYYSIGIWTHLMYHITHPLHHYCTNKLWQRYMRWYVCMCHIWIAMQFKSYKPSVWWHEMDMQKLHDTYNSQSYSILEGYNYT